MQDRDDARRGKGDRDWHEKQDRSRTAWVVEKERREESVPQGAMLCHACMHSKQVLQDSER